MVERMCYECNEVFHPYNQDDFTCDSCIDDLNTLECKVCGFDFKADNSSSKVCPDCLFDLEIDNDFVD